MLRGGAAVDEVFFVGVMLKKDSCYDGSAFCFGVGGGCLRVFCVVVSGLRVNYCEMGLFDWEYGVLPGSVTVGAVRAKEVSMFAECN